MKKVCMLFFLIAFTMSCSGGEEKNAEEVAEMERMTNEVNELDSISNVLEETTNEIEEKTNELNTLLNEL